MTDPGATLGPDPDDPRPWEQPGAVRRDVEPHRGNWLLLLAAVTFLLGASSLAVVVPGWLAVPLGFAVDRLAVRDLRRMRAGTMDPDGHAQAKQARRLADLGTILGVLGGGGCGLYLFLGVVLVLFLARQ
jgi:hypothetical protein